jgi:predicted ATPase
VIDRLSLENFKSFKKQEFRLKPLTLMAGVNSSGKSSIIQAIRLLSARNSGFSILEGHGGYTELRSTYADANQEIKIGVAFPGEEFEYWQTADGGRRFIPQPADRASLLHHAQYISADRLGPQVFFRLPQARGGQTVGERGENIILYCIWHKDNLVDEIRRHPFSTGESFEYTIEAWMSVISPGTRLEFIYDRQIDTGSLRIGQKGDLTISQRPTNVGFGLSYTLPVVASLLGAERGDLLLIENPEAHLHPIGQTKMGELLARTAQCGVQIIVETHSDHLIDGARIAVRDKVLSPENSIVLFCSKSASTHLSQVEELSFLDNGELDNWPEGFCDQSLKNLSKLAQF